MRDYWPVVLPLALAAAVMAFGIWVAAFASCSSLGWLPIQSAPLRCLPEVKP